MTRQKRKTVPSTPQAQEAHARPPVPQKTSPQSSSSKPRSSRSGRNDISPDALPTHFRPQALKFLRGLERNNRRDWFDPRKPEFERELRQPMLKIIEQVTSAMAGFAPTHMRPAQKCMMRIYRDTRFSSDKSPYKRNVAAWWSREGLEKTSGGGFYLHVSSKEVVIAAGVYMPERNQLLAIRTFLLAHHDEVRRLLKDPKLRRLLDRFEGLALTRPPKGFSKNDPAMDLLLCRQWGVSTTLPAEAAINANFVREIVKRFRSAAPLVEALNTPLVHSMELKPRVLFPMVGLMMGSLNGKKQGKNH